MKGKIVTILSALLIAALMFTCMAPAAIGESNYDCNPDQTNGEDQKFMSDSPKLMDGMGASAIGAGIGATAGAIAGGVGVMAATGVGAVVAVAVIGLFWLFWWLFG